MNKCKDCHWHTGCYGPKSNGKILPCTNIGVDGWNYWCDEQKEPEHCEGFCKTGEYVPTGIWAQIAGVVQRVSEIVEGEKQ
jgi:hypothetical protein